MPKRKRYRMLKFKINEASYVDVPAQDGADALFMKRADGGDEESDWPIPRLGESRAGYVKRFCGAAEVARDIEDLGGRVVSGFAVWDDAAAVDVEKRCGVPILTNVVDGHAHIVWLDGDRGGETTYQGVTPEADKYTDHSHPWVIDTAGILTVAENHGHDHVIDQSSVQAAMREFLIESGDTPIVVADVVFARSAGGVPYEIDNLHEMIAGVDSGLLCAVHEGVPVLGKSYLPGGSFPIRTSADLANAIASAGSNPQDVVARHIVKRARGLDLVDEGDVAFAEIAKSVAGPAGEPNMENAMPGTTKGAKKGADDDTISKVEHDKVVAELEVAKQEATLTDGQRAHYNDLEGDAAGAFLGKSAAERDTELADLAKGDPVVYTSKITGAVFRKSDDERLVEMAKQSDADRAELVVEKAARIQGVLEKRAADELGHLPGSLAHRAALLKAVGGIEDEEVRKGVAETLVAANKAAQGIFVKVGTTAAGVDVGSAGAELEKKAKALQATADFDGDYFDAYAKVSEDEPDLAKRALVEKPALPAIAG